MKRSVNTVLFIFTIVTIIFTSSPLIAGTITTTWSGDAEKVYDIGFAQNIMKHAEGGISLFNMELIENDGPRIRSVVRDQPQGHAGRTHFAHEVHGSGNRLVALVGHQGPFDIKQ